MATKQDLASAQEAFYSALRQSESTVADMRFARTGSRRGTQETDAVEPPASLASRSATPTKPRFRPLSRRRRLSQIQITAGSKTDSDLQATLMLVKRLCALGSTEGSAEIVCLDNGSRLKVKPAQFTCKGLQGFWTRTGKRPPAVRYTEDTLDQVLDTNPLAIFMDPVLAPDTVPGYIKVVLDDPCVCMLLREH